jgi:fumarylacetoacetase
MLRSFIEVSSDDPFPIQNLPFGIFSSPNNATPRGSTRIGSYVIDLQLLETKGLLPTTDLFRWPTLNDFLVAGPATWRSVRAALQELLDERNPRLRDDRLLRQLAFLPLDQVKLHLPVAIGDYTDFYSSKQHASNVGAMFRDKNHPLLPNWLHLPVAYHGRASSLIISGTPIRRPYGQVKHPDEAGPRLEPSREMDFELELGCVIGLGNALGDPVPVERAHEQVFGLVLVNDWSARDIQRWEYAPLGPFLAKSLGTSLSPWIVTLEALEPFRTTGPVQDPLPLPYLQRQEKRSYDIQLEVRLRPAGGEAEPICRTNFKKMYWDLNQQIAHHTVNGCNLRVGDLIASGTISGNEPGTYGSLLELTWGGTSPIRLSGGDQRTFLEDGDSVIFSGYAQGDGFRVGFGDLEGTILPARAAGGGLRGERRKVIGDW